MTHSRYYHIVLNFRGSKLIAGTVRWAQDNGLPDAFPEMNFKILSIFALATASTPVLSKNLVISEMSPTNSPWKMMNVTLTSFLDPTGDTILYTQLAPHIKHKHSCWIWHRPVSLDLISVLWINFGAYILKNVGMRLVWQIPENGAGTSEWSGMGLVLMVE